MPAAVAPPLSPPSTGRVGPLTLVVVGVWFLLVLSLSLLGVFWRATPAQPPVALGLSVGLPILGFALAYRGSAIVRRWVRSFDLGLLTIVQSWRVVGFAFVCLYGVGLLPGTFAVPAGLGDILVGLTAPFVARSVVPRLSARRAVFLGWTALGLADLALALTLGVLSSLTPLGLVNGAPATASLVQLPLSLIPTFGVPLMLIAHFAALLVVRARLSNAQQPGLTELTPTYA